MQGSSVRKSRGGASLRKRGAGSQDAGSAGSTEFDAWGTSPLPRRPASSSGAATESASAALDRRAARLSALVAVSSSSVPPRPRAAAEACESARAGWGWGGGGGGLLPRRRARTGATAAALPSPSRLGAAPSTPSLASSASPAPSCSSSQSVEGEVHGEHHNNSKKQSSHDHHCQVNLIRPAGSKAARHMTRMSPPPPPPHHSVRTLLGKACNGSQGVGAEQCLLSRVPLGPGTKPRQVGSQRGAGGADHTLEGGAVQGERGLLMCRVPGRSICWKEGAACMHEGQGYRMTLGRRGTERCPIFT